MKRSAPHSHSIVAVRDALAAITDERRRLGASRRACELVADPEHRFRATAPNVIGIVRGSDPVLKDEYVVYSAHMDHIGTAASGQGCSTMGADTICNGADDDGSGSMALLEIAEAIQSMKVKPKRSVLFVWHTGEEGGLVGSAFFTRNPTVPMDSIVAQLNIDMIGRGRAEDLPGGGPDYLGVVGSFFDSKDLGETVAAVNTRQAKPLALDYKFDSTVIFVEGLKGFG